MDKAAQAWVAWLTHQGRTGKQMKAPDKLFDSRWFTCVLLCLLLPMACVAQSQRAPESPYFEGEWRYTKKCDFGHFVGIDLNQHVNDVTGNWDEGTNLRGNEGLLRGKIREGKLFVQLCSVNLEAGYEECPKYDEENQYFVREGEKMIRYQKFGTYYVRDIALQRVVPGQELSVDNSDCEDQNNQDGSHG